MHDQTRTLLGFLAEEKTDRMLHVLREKSRTESQLAELLGTKQKATNARLNRLKGFGLVSGSTTQNPRQPGQPPRLWRISDLEVFRFCESADTFAFKLAKARFEDFESYIADSAGQNST